MIILNCRKIPLVKTQNHQDKRDGNPILEIGILEIGVIRSAETAIEEPKDLATMDVIENAMGINMKADGVLGQGTMETEAEIIMAAAMKEEMAIEVVMTA